MYKNKLDKLPEELSRKGQAVGEAVRVALLDFCGQNAEFAQAVEQGGSLADCIESTVKDAGGEHFGHRSVQTCRAVLLCGR